MTLHDSQRRLCALNTNLLDDLDMVIKLFIFIVIDTPRFLCFFSGRRGIRVTPSGAAAVCGCQIFALELLRAQRFQSFVD